MGFRVDRIAVEYDLNVDFSPTGSRTIRFEYAPLQDDPLVALALQKNRERLLAAARAESGQQQFMFGYG